VETVQSQALELYCVLSIGTNKKYIWLLPISHWTLNINCHSRGETVAMYSRITKAFPWFFPGVVHITFYVNGPYGTMSMQSLLQGHISKDASPREFRMAADNAAIRVYYKSAAFGSPPVLAHRIFVTIKVYIRHVSSRWILFLLIADRDISMYIHHVFHCTYMYCWWNWRHYILKTLHIEDTIYWRHYILNKLHIEDATYWRRYILKMLHIETLRIEDATYWRRYILKTLHIEDATYWRHYILKTLHIEDAKYRRHYILKTLHIEDATYWRRYISKTLYIEDTIYWRHYILKTLHIEDTIYWRRYILKTLHI